MKSRPSGLGIAALLVSAASPAFAHIAQVPYNLPVPFWMYAYGATAALVASFVVVGFFVKADAGARHQRVRDISHLGVVRAIGAPATLATLRLLSVLTLALTIATGLFGNPSMNANFGMTFFWIVFVLGATYLTTFIGDFYAVLNPWRALCDWIAARLPAATRPAWAYPAWLGYYPALVFYIVFIWLELFAHATPHQLGITLLVYSALNFAGVRLFGRSAWFQYAELFAVFFRLVAKCAPVDIVAPTRAGGPLQIRLRAPFSGVVASRPDHFSLIVFVLFMLSSTAFDGIHDTVAWVAIFWGHLYPMLAAVIATHNPRQYLVLVNYFYYWQWLMLALSPFLYLAVYYGFIVLTRWVTRSERSLRELALAFAYSLIPIAIVYNASHYFTLFIGEAPAMASLISDPFGFRWNLFGTRDLDWAGIMIEAGYVWHTQVWLILIGHIVSVYLSHVEALQTFKTTRQATLSQLPLLLLMVALTTVGLWILSLPIASGQVMLPPPGGS